MTIYDIKFYVSWLWAIMALSFVYIFVFCVNKSSSIQTSLLSSIFFELVIYNFNQINKI